MKGILSPAEIENLLHRQVVGRLACCAEGEVYIVPISYAYDGEYIYCHSEEGLKTSIMRKNPRVCFQVDEMRNMAQWKSVITWGEFEELTTENEKEKALNILMNRMLPVASSETTHLGSQWPFAAGGTEDVGGLFFRIHIYKKTGRFEQEEASPQFPG
ncbi:MAG TPA: pyridoxamine 5'-phosphate oxidase family protein [Chitinophagaceae bacterium]|nr:pyridoxamine 5'-phosphate oxidase family protein [Chitinophagaceae bacterium]